MQISEARRRWLAPFLLAAPLYATANPVLEWNDIAIKAARPLETAADDLTKHGGGSFRRVRCGECSSAQVPGLQVQRHRVSHRIGGCRRGGCGAHRTGQAVPGAACHVRPGPYRLVGQGAGGRSRNDGVALGTAAAQTILIWCADDRVGAVTQYRPVTKPGSYIRPLPAAHDFALSRPWLLKSADQFRPPAPPALTSETWARDLNEIQRIGPRLHHSQPGADASGAVLGDHRGTCVQWRDAPGVGAPQAGHAGIGARGCPRLHGLQRCPGGGLRREVHLPVLAADDCGAQR